MKSQVDGRNMSLMLKTPATLRDWPLGFGLTLHCSHMYFKVILLFLYTIYEYLHFAHFTLLRCILLEREVNVHYPYLKLVKDLLKAALWLISGGCARG